MIKDSQNRNQDCVLRFFRLRVSEMSSQHKPKLKMGKE